MPHIVIHLSGPRDPALLKQAVRTVEALTQSVLGKVPAVMATTVRFIAAEDWFIGGTPLSETGASAFNLEISITDETNTKAQKALYLRKVHEAMSALLPACHETS